jgi:hypothetical protein
MEAIIGEKYTISLEEIFKNGEGLRFCSLREDRWNDGDDEENLDCEEVLACKAIPDSETASATYYDLFNEYGIMAACDGEIVEVVAVTANYVELYNEDAGDPDTPEEECYFKLTVEEFEACCSL